jgi:hypothetical protein
MSVARFKVRATFDGAGGMKDGTFEIDRETGNVVVRPKGSRTTFHVPLSSLATWACRVGMQVKTSSKETEPEPDE